jgi:hypothetical protein
MVIAEGGVPSNRILPTPTGGMMTKYDPHKITDPQAWNELDEAERMLLVEQYHKRKRSRLPNRRFHAIIHVAVENQVSMGDELTVAETLDRLISEGLDRHDAIHAIGSVLAEHLHGVMGGKTRDLTHSQYFAGLKDMTAAKWRAMG